MASKIQALAVILAGGRGTRLAPLSLTFGNNLPKQFLTFVKKRTMLQEAVNRIPAEAAQLIVPEEQYREEVLRQTENKVDLIAEPFGCNTTAAIGLAAMYALSKGYAEKTVLFVLPADHYMDTRLFRKYFDTAVTAAAKGKIVTIGITPDRPETGYGYIKANKKLQHFFEKQHLYEVVEFVEKPKLEIAQQYLDSKDYFWNAGMFAFTIKTILAALEKNAPVVHKSLQDIRNNLGTPQESETIKREYEAIRNAGQNISIDYSVMEKEAKNILLLPADTKLDWNDVGGWIALERYCKADEAKNRAFNKVEFQNSSNVFALNYRAEQLVHAENLQDMLLVNTNNGVLICPKTEAQRAKEIIPRLEQKEKIIEIDSSNNTVENSTGIPVALIKCEGLKVQYLAEKLVVSK
jgi:mannose-1-phosphate guanylyltransferase/mannose-6-phosphate isomerase